MFVVGAVGIGCVKSSSRVVAPSGFGSFGVFCCPAGLSWRLL